jgi:hypothetical protein
MRDFIPKIIPNPNEMNKQEQEFAEFQRRARDNMTQAVRNLKWWGAALAVVTVVQAVFTGVVLWRMFH